jgi:hypothetical protein
VRNLACTFGACLAVISFAASPELASAAVAKSLYAKKWDECRELARTRHFGIHWVKRNRWIRNCIVDARSKRF